MKRLIVGLVMAATATIGFGSVAFADVSSASPCGAVHGAFANTNGNFGFLGADGGTPGYHNGAVGQDVGATGYNNSTTGCNP